MNKAYSAIGGLFEYLNDDCGYQQWSQYLISKLISCGVESGVTGLDMGCGNGYFTRAFKSAGYDVTGVDISPEMLSAAVEYSQKTGVKTEFVLGDILNFKSPKKCAFVTAVNDCINYIPGAKLKTAFRSIYNNLKKGGVFIFDISTEKKLREVLGNNLFAEDRGDVAYMWFNELTADCVNMDITLFKRRSDGAFERFDEAQTQYIHGATLLKAVLKEIGFTVECEEHPFGEKEMRINFICRKL